VLAAALPAGGQNRLTTSNGSVNVTLQGVPDVKLDASTSNGRVTSRLPITATQTGDHSLSGSIGPGDAGLIIHTSNGAITIQ
jgi:DUF4097 and DUF4098 domain-containing protein YvlB